MVCNEEIFRLLFALLKVKLPLILIILYEFHMSSRIQRRLGVYLRMRSIFRFQFFLRILILWVNFKRRIVFTMWYYFIIAPWIHWAFFHNPFIIGLSVFEKCWIFLNGGHLVYEFPSSNPRLQTVFFGKLNLGLIKFFYAVSTLFGGPGLK